MRAVQIEKGEVNGGAGSGGSKMQELKNGGVCAEGKGGEVRA